MLTVMDACTCEGMHMFIHISVMRVRVFVFLLACYHLMCFALIWLKLVLILAVQDSKA